MIEVTSGEGCLELMENNYNDTHYSMLFEKGSRKGKTPLSAEAVTRRARALGAAI